MRIGIIGAGQIGGTLTGRLAQLGHEVFVANSRGPASRRFMIRIWAAPVCGMHWPKRKRSACLSGGPQGTQAGSPNVPDAESCSAPIRP